MGASGRRTSWETNAGETAARNGSLQVAAKAMPIRPPSKSQEACVSCVLRRLGAFGGAVALKPKARRGALPKDELLRGDVLIPERQGLRHLHAVQQVEEVNHPLARHFALTENTYVLHHTWAPKCRSHWLTLTRNPKGKPHTQVGAAGRFQILCWPSPSPQRQGAWGRVSLLLCTVQWGRDRLVAHLPRPQRA